MSNELSNSRALDGIMTRLTQFEAGQLNDEETVVLYQMLIQSGLIGQLSAEHKRRAQSFIETGLCTAPDYWN